MTEFTDHPAFSWLGKDALSLPIYAERFDGATIFIGGESPYLDAKMAGIELALNADQTVKVVHLYSEGIEGFAAYADPLPTGLSLSSSRAEVCAALGEPVRRGEKGGVGIMAIEYSWDRFEANGKYPHFEYLPGDGAVRLATIGLCSN